MKTVNKISLITSIIFTILFFGIGILVLSLSIKDSFNKESYKTEAVITKIDDRNSTIYVEFEYNGVTYNLPTNFYDTSCNIGDIVKIIYSEGNDYVTDGSPIIIIIGCVLVAIASGLIIFVVRQYKKSSKVLEIANEKEEEYHTIISSDDYEFKEYYFHRIKSTNNFALEDLNKNVLFEAILDKTHIFKPCEYTFINHETGIKKKHKITNPITTSTASGFMYNSTAYFKFDGVKIWDYLEKKGYKINYTGRDFSSFKYTVLRGNNTAGFIEPKMKDQEGNENKILSALKIPGFYKIITDYDNLYYMFVLAFALSRCDGVIDE